MPEAGQPPRFPSGGINGPVQRWIAGLGDLSGRTVVDGVPQAARRAILAEHARVNLAWGTPVGKHLFWVLEKQRDLAAHRTRLKSLTRGTRAAAR